MRSTNRLALLSAIAIGVIVPTSGAALCASTLNDALAAAYANNPTLSGQRASLRATDENAAIARAPGRPQLSAQAGVSQGLEGLRAVDGFNRSITAGVTASLPLYQGGRVRNTIDAADKRSAAGRETLRATEGDIFVQTVSAYLSVLRDREIVQLSSSNVDALQADAKSSKERYNGGDLTLTDVDQSNARLINGRTQLATAQSNLIESEEDFRRLTGQLPGTLETPPALPLLPDSADQAEDTAIDNNATVLAAAQTIEASRYDAGAARGSALPTLSLSAGNNYYDYRDRIVALGDTSGNSSQVGLTLTIPLYQGGIVSARVRQANDVVSQAMDQKIEAERQVSALARATFSRYRTVQNNIRLDEDAVKVNQRALFGVRTENSAGLRQVLDVLNAQLELINSQIALATARSDAYVAGFQLLDAMGYADGKHLGLNGGTLYDPMINFRHAKHELSDFANGPQPQAAATYTPERRGK
jgi:outer membrane protein